jgi:hypothetical protein
MKKCWIVFALVFIIAPQLSAEENITHDHNSVLIIHVVNGTQAGRVLEGTAVNVNFYQANQLIKNASAFTDPNGDCIIEDVPLGDDVVAVAQARHSDMFFSSPPKLLPHDQHRHELSIEVYEVAYEDNLITVGTHHLIMKTGTSNIHVTEYVQLINDTDKAVLSETKDSEDNYNVVEFSLPKNYENLTFSSYFHNDAIVQTKTGFYDTMAIPPGSYHAVFSYDVPLSKKETTLQKAITLPTKSMMVFIEAGGAIKSDLGEPAGSMNLKDGTPADYFNVDVSEDTVLTFHAEPMTADVSKLNIWIAMSIVFAVVIVIAAFRLRPAAKD